MMERSLMDMSMDGFFYYVEMFLVEVLGYMEYEGIKVDKSILDELSVEFKEIIVILEKEIYELLGELFNINLLK